MMIACNVRLRYTADGLFLNGSVGSQPNYIAITF